jgi:hypothetical protein
MKKTSIVLFLFGTLCYVTLSGNAAGPGSINSVEGTGGAGCNCHSVSATTTTGVSLQLLSSATPVTTYTPGASYTIRVTGTNTSSSLVLPRFGYQVVAVKTSTTTNAGTLTAPAGSHTVAVTSGVKVAEHSSALLATSGTGGNGTTYVVNVPWTAPAAGMGSVTIRTLLNAVNGNTGADAGDKWNIATLTVTQAAGTAIAMPKAEGELKVFPNPSKGSFSLELPANAAEPAFIVITDMAGVQVKTFTQVANTSNISTTLPPGTYMLSATTMLGNYISRIVIE